MMKKLLLSTTLFLFTLASYAQLDALVYATEVANMPMPVTNNAVVGTRVNNTNYVYSFGGMDSTKIWSGITKKAFRYNTFTDIWDTIPDLPNPAVIAASASYVDSIIYIIGGYQVLSNGNEISSNIVTRFDPRTNTYLSNGANIPIPIDDQVQAVWRDSLIYVITGWSNTGNVPNVQIYDPANDNWMVGTPVPNNNTYKAFGAAGIIMYNTIYYHGGASMGLNFPTQSTFRIGQIDPNNPTNITWSIQATNYTSYRAVAVYDSWTNLPAFIGGSEVSYNYDGIAYNGSGGVSPKGFSLGFSRYFPQIFSKTVQQYVTMNNQPADTILPMDLRGVAFPSYNSYIAGGMLRNQTVSNKTFGIEFYHASSVNEYSDGINFQLFPNPSSHQITMIFQTNAVKKIRLLNVLGKEVLTLNTTKRNLQIDVATYPKGIYLVKVKTDKGTSTQKLLIE